MKKTQLKLVVLALVPTAILNVTSCSTTTGRNQMPPPMDSATAQAADSRPETKLMMSIREIQAETFLTGQQLRQTVTALDALVSQKTGDLRPAYDTFVEEVKKTHTAAEQTASRSRSMQSASVEYFSAWQAEISGISSASLRKKAQDRLDSVHRDYDKVVDSLQEAANEFKPFLSDLDDVQKALANDVTPGGVKAVRGTASDASFHVKTVSRYIGDAVEELDGMRQALSPEANG